MIMNNMVVARVVPIFAMVAGGADRRGGVAEGVVGLGQWEDHHQHCWERVGAYTEYDLGSDTINRRRLWVRRGEELHLTVLPTARTSTSSVTLFEHRTQRDKQSTQSASVGSHLPTLRRRKVTAAMAAFTIAARKRVRGAAFPTNYTTTSPRCEHTHPPPAALRKP